jgi:hypothetical protein
LQRRFAPPEFAWLRANLRSVIVVGHQVAQHASSKEAASVTLSRWMKPYRGRSRYWFCTRSSGWRCQSLDCPHAAVAHRRTSTSSAHWHLEARVAHRFLRGQGQPLGHRYPA